MNMFIEYTGLGLLLFCISFCVHINPEVFGQMVDNLRCVMRDGVGDERRKMIITN